MSIAPLEEGLCLVIRHWVKGPGIEEHGLALAGTELAPDLFRFGHRHEFSHGRVIARNDDSLYLRHAGQQFREVSLGLCNLNGCHRSSMTKVGHHWGRQTGLVKAPSPATSQTANRAHFHPGVSTNHVYS